MGRSPLQARISKSCESLSLSTAFSHPLSPISPGLYCVLSSTASCIFGVFRTPFCAVTCSIMQEQFDVALRQVDLIDDGIPHQLRRVRLLFSYKQRYLVPALGCETQQDGSGDFASSLSNIKYQHDMWSIRQSHRISSICQRSKWTNRCGQVDGHINMRRTIDGERKFTSCHVDEYVNRGPRNVSQFVTNL